MAAIPDGFSIKVTNLKCFSDSPQGFDELKPINVIIGRNNSGKSALLDLVSICVGDNFEVARNLWHGGSHPEFVFGGMITESHAQQVFPQSTSGGNLPGNHWEFGRGTIGSMLTWKRTGKGDAQFLDIGDAPDGLNRLKVLRDDRGRQEFGGKLARTIGNPFSRMAFRRMSADRNVHPEGDNSSLGVDAEGNGATNIIHNYLDKAALDRRLVEDRLLKALNEVFHPDAHFLRIVCQQLDSGAWEVYLEEADKGVIALSQSGSGLKTVMLVLVNLILVPDAEQKKLGDYAFGFEELENNLHPSLLRRLLSFLASKAQEHEFMLFLTTHSSAAIDLFSKNSLAQIIHVRHNGQSAVASKVMTYVDNCGVLDDLDVRASDLLQANSVIWVEGPSDRIYINQWISLWSGGELQEGLHYQCIFYGGRLLAHLESRPPEDAGSGVSILRVARHACVIMDSDKRAQQTPINATKRRIAEEIESVGGLVWITKGREIENYIPRAAFDEWRGWDSPEPSSAYEDVFEYMDTQEDGVGCRLRGSKPLLAEAIIPYLTRERCQTVLDLDEQMIRLCRKIREWNNVGER